MPLTASLIILGTYDANQLTPIKNSTATVYKTRLRETWQKACEHHRQGVRTWNVLDKRQVSWWPGYRILACAGNAGGGWIAHWL